MNRSSAFGEYWAEFVGTALLIIFGDGVVANVVFHPRLAAGGYNWDTIAWGWGFAVAMAVYVAGGITGAHINPAVTLANVIRKNLSFGKAIGYWIAQIIGAFVGAGLVYLCYQGCFVTQGYKNVFYTGAGQGISLGTAFFTEVLATFCLLIFISAIVDAVNNNGPGANLWPFMVGIAIVALGLSLGGPSGYAMNPARDLGPRLFAALFAGDTGGFVGNYWWTAPIIAPLLGGVLGALFYDFGITPFLPNAAKNAQQIDSSITKGA